MRDDDSGEREFRRDGDAYLLPGRLEAIEREQAEQRDRDEHYKRRDDEFKRRQVNLNRSLTLLTGGLLVVGIVGGLISLWQTSIAQQGATAAIRAANVSEQARVDSTASNEQTLRHMKAQADAATTAAATAAGVLREAERANRLTQSAANQQLLAARRDLRAWIGVADFALDKEPADGGTIKVTVRIANTGRTPAVDLTNATVMSVFSAPVVVNWDQVPAKHPTVVFPGAVGISITTDDLKIPPRTTEAYKQGILNVWIQGRFQYRDVFQRNHWITFCAFHTNGQNLTTFSYCETGNAIDDES